MFFHRKQTRPTPSEVLDSGGEYRLSGTPDLVFAREAVENVLNHRGLYKGPLFSRTPSFGLSEHGASRKLYGVWNALALDSIDHGGGSADQTYLRELMAEMLVVESLVLKEVRTVPDQHRR